MLNRWGAFTLPVDPCWAASNVNPSQLSPAKTPKPSVMRVADGSLQRQPANACRQTKHHPCARFMRRTVDRIRPQAVPNTLKCGSDVSSSFGPRQLPISFLEQLAAVVWAKGAVPCRVSFSGRTQQVQLARIVCRLTGRQLARLPLRSHHHLMTRHRWYSGCNSMATRQQTIHTMQPSLTLAALTTERASAVAHIRRRVRRFQQATGLLSSRASATIATVMLTTYPTVVRIGSWWTVPNMIAGCSARHGPKMLLSGGLFTASTCRSWSAAARSTASDANWIDQRHDHSCRSGRMSSAHECAEWQLFGAAYSCSEALFDLLASHRRRSLQSRRNNRKRPAALSMPCSLSHAEDAGRTSIPVQLSRAGDARSSCKGLHSTRVTEQRLKLWRKPVGTSCNTPRMQACTSGGSCPALSG